MNNIVIGIQSRISLQDFQESHFKIGRHFTRHVHKRALKTGFPVYLLTSENEEDNLIALKEKMLV